MQKKKVGIFSFTCCEGCTVTLIELMNTRFFEYRERMEISNFRIMRTNRKIGKMDFAIIEGAISTESEKRKLLEIRKNAKKIVAIGSCAITGMPSAQRNFFDEEKKKRIKEQVVRLHQLKTIEPLKKYVKVDFQIPGCPCDKRMLDDRIEELLGGKNAPYKLQHKP